MLRDSALDDAEQHDNLLNLFPFTHDVIEPHQSIRNPFYDSAHGDHIYARRFTARSRNFASIDFQLKRNDAYNGSYQNSAEPPGGSGGEADFSPLFHLVRSLRPPTSASRPVSLYSIHSARSSSDFSSKLETIPEIHPVEAAALQSQLRRQSPGFTRPASYFFIDEDHHGEEKFIELDDAESGVADEQMTDWLEEKIFVSSELCSNRETTVRSGDSRPLLRRMLRWLCNWYRHPWNTSRSHLPLTPFDKIVAFNTVCIQLILMLIPLGFSSHFDVRNPEDLFAKILWIFFAGNVTCCTVLLLAMLVLAVVTKETPKRLLGHRPTIWIYIGTVVFLGLGTWMVVALQVVVRYIAERGAGGTMRTIYVRHL